MSVIISRVLHAGYVFESAGTQIIFDPIFETPFSRNCFPYPAVEFDHAAIDRLRFDAIFISHYHDDHCSFESLRRLDRATPIYLFCVHPEMFALLARLGFTTVHALALDTPVTVGAFEITPRRAFDADVDSIFHIKTAGLNILNVVDAWIDDDTLERLARDAPWDLVLWPFQTMRELEALAPSRASPQPAVVPDEWAAQLAALRPRYLVPSSCQFIFEPWSWLNHRFFPISYRMFAAFAVTALPEVEVIRLDPGTSVTLDHEGLRRSAPLAWMRPIGDQNIDYEFRPDEPAPSMAAVTRRFPALDREQSARVRAYCREGLITRYAELEPTDEPYFETTRTWRLEVYDHAGAVRTYHYRVHPMFLEAVSQSPPAVDWFTQIAETRLYGALDQGESLSSLYVRINDEVFDPETAHVREDVDVIQDPLLRCLYTGRFGSYQIAQLARSVWPLSPMHHDA